MNNWLLVECTTLWGEPGWIIYIYSQRKSMTIHTMSNIWISDWVLSIAQELCWKTEPDRRTVSSANQPISAVPAQSGLACETNMWCHSAHRSSTPCIHQERWLLYTWTLKAFMLKRLKYSYKAVVFLQFLLLPVSLWQSFTEVFLPLVIVWCSVYVFPSPKSSVNKWQGQMKALSPSLLLYISPHCGSHWRGRSMIGLHPCCSHWRGKLFMSPTCWLTVPVLSMMVSMFWIYS